MHLDWGNVPAWAGSVLSGGSLLLGFSIMRNDRKQREREDAKMLSCRLRRERLDLVVFVTNVGNSPIHHLSTAVTESSGGTDIAHLPDHGLDIQPGTRDEVVFRTRAVESETGYPQPLYITFSDINGRRWKRDFEGRLTCTR